MASLKKIVYIVGTVTSGDDSKYMTARDIGTHFDDEDNILNRVRSQIQGCNLFAVKRIGGRNFWKLNKNGEKYFNNIKDSYDPVTDKLLFQADKIEVF